MLEVDAGCGTIILAGGMDGRRIAEATHVIRPGLGIEPEAGARPLTGLAAQVVFRVAADHALGHVERLDQEAPVIITGRHLLVERFEQGRSEERRGGKEWGST